MGTPQRVQKGLLESAVKYGIIDRGKKGEHMRYDGRHGTISFDKLFEVMERKNFKKIDLRNAGVHAATVQKLKNGGNVTTEVIAHLCEILHCQPSDIMEYIPPK